MSIPSFHMSTISVCLFNSTNGVIYTSGFQKITQSLTYLNKPNILYLHLINVKLELNACSLFSFIISSLSLNGI